MPFLSAFFVLLLLFTLAVEASRVGGVWLFLAGVWIIPAVGWLIKRVRISRARHQVGQARGAQKGTGLRA